MTHNPMTRRSFHAALAGGIALGTAPLALAQTGRPAGGPAGAPKEEPAFAEDLDRDYPPPGFKPRFRRPQIKAILIQDFVVYAHYDLEMVKLLLEKEPGLINTTVDWGAGDWESALGAASHIGRRDIAEFLLSKGARIDIFCATMLGHLDVVKSLLTIHPQLIDARGPHGITLVSHAKAGKEKAADVLAFLESFKKPETKVGATP